MSAAASVLVFFVIADLFEGTPLAAPAMLVLLLVIAMLYLLVLSDEYRQSPNPRCVAAPIGAPLDSAGRGIHGLEHLRPHPTRNLTHRQPPT